MPKKKEVVEIKEEEEEQKGRCGEKERTDAGTEAHAEIRHADDWVPTGTRREIDGGRFTVRFLELEGSDEKRRGERREMSTAREPAVAEI